MSYFCSCQHFLQKLYVSRQNNTFIKPIVQELCQRFFNFVFSCVRQKVAINGKISFIDCATGIHPPDCSKFAINWKNSNEVTISQHDVNVNFFRSYFFLLPGYVTGLSFMLVSSVVLKLWPFPFIKDWPEIQKSGMPPSEFWPISGDWGKLGIPNFALLW